MSDQNISDFETIPSPFETNMSFPSDVFEEKLFMEENNESEKPVSPESMKAAGTQVITPSTSKLYNYHELVEHVSSTCTNLKLTCPH